MKTISSNDSFSIYNVSIKNFSDSITCILHSHFILLSIGNDPQSLAALALDKKDVSYNLKEAARDTLFTYEVPQYRASIILPYQALYFEIKVSASSKEQFLSIDYFHLFDIHYRKFQDGMLLGRWYERYHLNTKKIPLPK